MSLRFGCFEDNEGVVVAPSPSRAAFACGGAGESSVHGGRRPQIFLCTHFPPGDNDACCRDQEKRIGYCSDHSPPAPGTLRCRENNDFGRPPTGPPETRKHHPFRLLSTQGPRNCETMDGDVCVGGTPVPLCSCRRPWFLGRGGRGRRRSTKERRYGISRRWHASAAAAAAATLASRRWHAAAAAAAATLASRRWHAAVAEAAATLVSQWWHAAAAAAAAMVSRRWGSSSAST